MSRLDEILNNKRHVDCDTVAYDELTFLENQPDWGEESEFWSPPPRQSSFGFVLDEREREARLNAKAGRSDQELERRVSAALNEEGK